MCPAGLADRWKLALLQGKKCKFAHDLTIGSKGRLDLSRDLRDVRAEETAAGTACLITQLLC